MTPITNGISNFDMIYLIITKIIYVGVDIEIKVSFIRRIKLRTIYWGSCGQTPP